MTKHIPTQQIDHKIVSENPRLKLCEDRVRFHSGREAVHWKIDYAMDGVGVIPMFSDGRILLGLHHRYCLGEWSWEIPAGAVEPDEDHRGAGCRELEEETGYKAKEMEFLLNYYPAPGLGNEHFFIFAGRDLSKSDREFDNEEIYELRALTWPQIEEFIGAKKIIDGLTITALCYAKAKGIISP